MEIGGCAATVTLRSCRLNVAKVRKLCSLITPEQDFFCVLLSSEKDFFMSCEAGSGFAREEKYMDDTARKQSSSWQLILLVILILGFFGVGFFLQSNSVQKQAKIPAPTGSNVVPSITLLDYLSYKGEVGKDALTILKAHATISQDASGLVTSINGRSVDAGNKEYWAFYVNDKMSQVGPSDYQTQNTDVIEWKIEKY